MEKRKNKINWLVLTVLSFSLTLASCGGGGGSNPVSPSTDITLGDISVSTDIPQAGTQFTLTVSLGNETDLQQASLELSYNHSVIEMDSVASGGLLVDTNMVSFDGTTGNLLITYANFPLGTGSYTGSGTLCTITFDALSPGSPEISFTNTDTRYYYGNGSDMIPLLASPTITVQ